MVGSVVEVRVGGRIESKRNRGNGWSAPVRVLGLSALLWLPSLTGLEATVQEGSATTRSTAAPGVPAGSSLAALSAEAQAALAAGAPQRLLVLLDGTAARSAAFKLRRAGGSLSGERHALALKAELFASAKRGLLAALEASGEAPEVLWDYGNLPLLFLRVHSPAELDRLAARPEVVSIQEDRVGQLAQSPPTQPVAGLNLIRQPPVAAGGLVGTGTVVAVLDGPIDITRAAFGSCTGAGTPASCKVVAAPTPFTADNGGPASATDHATNVAGIVLSVAPDTRIAALEVVAADQTEHWADVAKAIDWCIEQRKTPGGLNIVAMNMSFGTATGFSVPCAGDSLAAVVAEARDDGILTVAAAGNSGLTGEIASPSCIPGAVSVGAVWDADVGLEDRCTSQDVNEHCITTCTDATTAADQITCFSNSSPFLTLFAPGGEILAAGITATGTSQATPFVAGAVAVLRAAFPQESPDQTVLRLTSSGRPLTRANTSYPIPRLDLWGASQAAPQTVSLGAAPAGGAAPLGTTLTATVSGAATGGIDYSFWWDCDDPRTTLSDVTAACGALAAPPQPGSCGAANANGIQCSGISDDPKAVSTTYNATRQYRPKVLAVRGGIAAESRTTVSVTQAPLVATAPATGVSASAATLNGSVNTELAPTQTWFEWSAQSDLSLATQTPGQGLPAGPASQAVSAAVTGLNPNSTYYFRAVASNAGGTARGMTLSLTTAGAGVQPAASTLAASAVTPSSATIAGTVNPNGADTQVQFEWGTSPVLAGPNVTAMQDAGAGPAAVAVSFPLSGLVPQTTYYYRVVATSSAGTSRGVILSFATLAASQTQLIGNGGFELGTPPWATAGSFHIAAGFPYPHSGSAYAFLSNPDGSAGNLLWGTLEQTVTIPNGVSSALLTFWYSISSQDSTTTPFDVLNVTVQDASGGYLDTVLTRSNVNQQAPGIYQQASYEMARYAGQTVRLQFLATTDGSLPTTFRIDDVSLLATTNAPLVVTSAASAVNAQGATLAGTVNPQGSAATAWFEWGTDPALGSYTQSPPQGVGPGTAPLPVSQPVSGLAAGTTYTFRAAAANASGTARGALATFTTGAGTTAPVVATVAASAVTPTTAMLNANVTPGPAGAAAWFEWGTDPALGGAVPTPSQPLAAGNSQVAVSATLSGLSPGTTYYFRAVAGNPGGTPRAATLGFTTPPAPALPHTLTLAAAGAPGGVAITVTPNDRNGQGSGTTPLNLLYDSGTAVTLTAPATSAGGTFLKWIDNGVDLTSSLTTTVTLDTDSTLTAVYGAAPGVQVLALGLDNPNSLALDGTNVYWLEASGLLRRIGKDGSGAATLASGLANPSGLARDGTSLYLGESQISGPCDIRRVAVDGSSSTIVTTDTCRVGRLALDGTNVYWTDSSAGAVRSAPEAGGAMSTLATGSSSPFGIATDGSRVYWTELASPGRLQSVPTGGGGVTLLATGTNAAGVATAGGRVFWTESVFADQGQINAVSPGGGIVTSLASGLTHPWDLALDGTNAYWVENFSSGTVKQVPLAGGSTILLASGLTSPVAVATDGASVYWLEQGDGGPSSGMLKRTPISICSYTFTPRTTSFPAAGGTGSVAVTAPPGCDWTASSGASWITVAAGGPASGSGTLGYTVAANTGPGPRLGSLQIQGQTFVVNQAGATSTAPFWGRIYGGGSGGDVARSLAATADGGLIAAGFTGFGAGGEDALLVRLDGSGNVLWRKTYGGIRDDLAEAVAPTADGGFLVGGVTSSFGAGNTDAWVLKLDGNGNVLWQQTYGGGAADSVTDIAATADGGSLLAGFTSSFGAGGGDLWLLKLDASGNVQWQRTYGGAGSEAQPFGHGRTVFQTADGGFVAVASSTISFSTGVSVAWVLKLDGNGNVQWQTKYGGQDSFYGVAAAAAADGGILVAGQVSPAGGGTPAAWVVKLDATGGIQWQQEWSTPSFAAEAQALAATADGGAIVAGGSQGAWMMKLDAAGNTVWSKHFAGGLFNSVAALAGGGFAAAGLSQSFGTTWVEFWVVKVDPGGNIGTACSLAADNPVTAATSHAAAAPTTITPSSSTAVPAGSGAVSGVPAINVAEECSACNPPPTATLSGTASICGGASTLLQATLTGTAPWTVTWSDGVTQSGITASPASRQASPTATTSYSVTAVADAACAGIASGSTQVTVVPSPPAPVLGNNGPLCAGGTLQLTAAPLAGAGYSWSGPAGFSSAAQNPALPGASAGASGTYSATATVNGCTSAPGTTSVTVNPVPAAPSASGNSPVCAGAPAELSAATVPGATYGWTGPGGFISTSQKPVIPSAVAANAGTYSVTATAGGCTSAPATTQLAVLATPSAVVGGGGTFCPGGAVNLSVALQGTPPWTLTWSDGLVQSGITASPAVRSVSPSATTSYSLLALSDASCSGSISGGAVADPSCKGFFFTVTPCRAVDTRNPSGATGGPALAAGSARTFALAGICGVPANARAVALNLTVIAPTQAGSLTAYPAGDSPTSTSAISFSGGDTRANNAVLPLSLDGNAALTLLNGMPSGTVQLAIDVTGYFL